MPKSKRRSRKDRRVVEPPWTPFKEGRSELMDVGVVFVNSRYQVWTHKAKIAEGFMVPNPGSDDGHQIEEMLHLSFKRNDRAVMDDWREKLRIKNEICDLLFDGDGAECEAVELYPAMSRCIDSANQYHLWVLPPGCVWPFGWMDRLVEDKSTFTDEAKRKLKNAMKDRGLLDDPDGLTKAIEAFLSAPDNSVQRPVPPWMRPGESTWRRRLVEGEGEL